MENIKLIIYGVGIIVLALLIFGILKKNALRTYPKLATRRMKKNEGSFFKLLFFPEIEIGSRISNLNKQLNKQAEDNNKLLQELVKLQKENLELRKREENRNLAWPTVLQGAYTGIKANLAWECRAEIQKKFECPQPTQRDEYATE